MIKSESGKAALATLLKGSNSLALAQGLEQLREEEPFEGALGLLTAFYDSSSDSRIRKTISNFICDIRDPEITSEMMAELEKPFSAETITMLVSSCWQSGLDYSSYPDEFAELFLRSDYVTALECLTVIEESVHKIDSKRRRELISMLEERSQEQEASKRGLTDELISVLRAGDE